MKHIHCPACGHAFKYEASRPDKPFVKPTIQDVALYCQERGNGIDAEFFWNSYESKGWMIGKTLMKSWKAAVHTWEKRSQTNGHAASAIEKYLKG